MTFYGMQSTYNISKVETYQMFEEKVVYTWC